MLRRGGRLLLLGLIAGCTSRHASARAGDLDPDPAAAVYLPAAFDGVRLPPPWASATPDPGLETRIDGARRLTAPPPGASDQNPAFSPDGSRLVFTRFENGYNDGPAALYALDLEDGAVSRLTPIEDQDNVNLPGAAWHPARDRIVFASDRAEADDLWWIAPDGTDLQRLTNHEGPDAFYEPSWSPDGTWIAFEARRMGNSEDGTLGRIWKVRADGSGATALTSGDHDDRQPNWSPAGNRIVFQRRRATGSVFDLYTMDASGGDLRPVTTANAGDTADDTDASWSADGRFVVYSSDAGTRPQPGLYAVPALGGEAVAVTGSPAADSAPSWSLDGKWIAFESRRSEGEAAGLWLIRAPDMNARLWPLWARSARLAGAAFEPEMTDAEIDAKLQGAADDGVSVLVVDGPTGWSYSAWVDDAEFQRALGLMRDRVIPRAHARGLRVAWYLTGLELVCGGCETSGRDPGAEHPDWLQVDRTGQPLEFTGLEDVFWLEPGDIDLWLAPESPYREFYLHRVTQLAGAGADALWLDVAYYLNALGSHDDLWPSYDPFSRRAFRAAYGHEEIPAKDWSSLAWRHFVRWRMESIRHFVADVAAAARAVAPATLFFTENWGMDSNYVTQYAQDPLDFHDNPFVATAHELEPVEQDDAGMGNATLAQWHDYAAMVKFAVASNRGKAAWVLTYAGAVDDSLREAALHLAEGASFYEAQGPEMLDDSTGSRQMVFRWLGDLAPLAAESKPVADVAVWYSPPTRDFVDGEEAGDDKFDYGTTTYIRSYRGASRQLLGAQIAYDVASMGSPLADLASYRWIALPGATCLSDREAALLKGYVAAGGRLAAPDAAGTRDEWCRPRARGALAGMAPYPLAAVASQAVTTTLAAADKGKVVVVAREGSAPEGRFLLIVLANLSPGTVFSDVAVSVVLPAGFTPGSAGWSAPEDPGGAIDYSVGGGRVDVVVPRLDTGVAVVVGDVAPLDH